MVGTDGFALVPKIRTRFGRLNIGGDFCVGIVVPRLWAKRMKLARDVMGFYGLNASAIKFQLLIGASLKFVEQN